MNTMVNCGVLGAGWWATTAHIPALQANPRVRIVAVQNRHLKEAQRVAADFNAGRAVTTVEEMVAVEGIEAVIDGSTPNMHYRNAKVCLEHNLHVLMEKPMTLTVAEAEELVTLATERGLQLLISCPWHYTAHAIEGRRLISEGHLGRLKMVSMLFTNFSGGLYRARTWKELFAEGGGDASYATPYIAPEINSYSDPLVAGGGQIFCQVSHAAAYLGFLTGSPPVEIFARFDNAELNIDVYDVLSAKLANGCLVSLASTGDTMLSQRQFEIRAYGTEGMLLMELWRGTMEFHSRRGEVTRYAPLNEDQIYPLFDPANNLVDAILGVAPNRSPGALGLYAMRIIESACASARTGKNTLVGGLPVG